MLYFRPFLLLSALLLLTGCTPRPPKYFSAEILPSPSSEPPLLAVHVAEKSAVVHMDIEAYVAGVVAGEMPNTWPLEALKAQAILARTFVLKFVSEKDSRYPGADISTDIAEAQAYNAEAVNERVLRAVQETAGLILLTEDGTLPYTWFHSHSGGMTETAVDGIDWNGPEPSFTKSTAGMEADAAAWSAEFSAADFIAACRKAGASVSSCKAVRVGQKGKSGRAVTLLVDGTTVNAARLRISLGSTKMRSTLLTELSAEDGVVRMSGRGYGHGVGLSQWGAYAMAQAGKSAEEISLHYYNGLRLVKAW
ncbi:MAG: SpoIID/LytB domain-containing protein [Clostridia bacterium]|nr:SpoIID/LytB domain-containing protein [Clostridia bacterium]